jgi:hypothetical protein
VIGRAMVADRAQRYKSADELKTALETLRRRAPGVEPQTLPFAGTIPIELMANAVPRGANAGAPAFTGGSGTGPGTAAEQAMTGAPLSHTTPESGAKGRGGLVWAVLGGVALVGLAAALMLARGSGPGHDTTGETVRGVGPGPNATAKAAGTPVVEPTLLPTAPATAAPPPSASVSAKMPSAAPKVEKPKGKTRAAEHGLSEQNPF